MVNRRQEISAGTISLVHEKYKKNVETCQFSSAWILNTKTNYSFGESSVHPEMSITWVKETVYLPRHHCQFMINCAYNEFRIHTSILHSKDQYNYTFENERGQKSVIDLQNIDPCRVVPQNSIHIMETMSTKFQILKIMVNGLIIYFTADDLLVHNIPISLCFMDMELIFERNNVVQRLWHFYS